MPTAKEARTAILFVAGLGMAIYNAVLGDHNYPTFIVALMFCGFPFIINLDEIIRKAPISVATPPPEIDPVKEAAP
jgi:hypothetical protein